ncbi:glycosyl hydrolase family 20 [Cytobacillus oceanisediminis]|uniref:Glycosyl hydrolase family 20 n=1 Tax=Cytobacillus oceanisediminis TaxID=665099 RepID=A0A2V2ZUZ2_9BACI|nr:beta-N-acetylhexosaminidase [Cytobacillus oceanisediminis]PWW28241.1 glycosyl hydrolase family 20 [Cytobacillus oceanisediminis]
MKLKFLGEMEELYQGIHELQTQLQFQVADDGFPILVEQTLENQLEVRKDGSQGLIRYANKIHFFRGLGLFIEKAMNQGYFYVNETPQFQMNGIMLDCSRNAVLKPDTVRTFLRYMAVMGLNMVMLYTEDTYTIKEDPYFGYMRGRYSESELKGLDDYAHCFGIEMIPCIQTLAHLSTYLKWSHTKDFKDTDDVLLVGHKETYSFIEKMIVSASSPFRSNRIHIGMDEAHGLGRGRFLDLHGKEERFKLMNKHLKELVKITSEYHLKPMVWSDMYFRVWSRTDAYYDLNITIPEEVLMDIPDDVQLVYWDYYNEDEDFYKSYFEKHTAFGKAPVFAGGIWTWHGPTIHYKKTFNTTNAALNMCKKQNVQEVFATLWGDDGAESNYYLGLLGMQLYAEHGYSEQLDTEKLRNRFEFCTGANYDAFLTMGNLDAHPSADWNKLIPDNPTKFLLWQDILIGLFDKHIEDLNFSSHYQSIKKEISGRLVQESNWDTLYGFMMKMCDVLCIKCDIGITISNLYKEKNMTKLKRIANEELTELNRLVKELRELHRDIWYKQNKAFGWEILDIRYGGLLARIETAQKRIMDYVLGNIDRIEELEEEKLYYDSHPMKKNIGIGKENKYTKIASVNVF